MNDKVSPLPESTTEPENGAENGAETGTHPIMVRFPMDRLAALRAYADAHNRTMANTVLHFATTNPEFVAYVEAA
jgi:hypothetical protein